MNTIDRPEGFKEKRAQLSIVRFYPQAKVETIAPKATTKAKTRKTSTSKAPAAVEADSIPY